MFVTAKSFPEQALPVDFQVQILIGKDKGKRGEVAQTVRERNWCFVAGKNLVRTSVGIEIIIHVLIG